MEGTTMTTQISALRRMSLKQLQEKYQEIFSKPTRNRNRVQLFSVIARRLQDGEEPESANKPVALPTLIAKFEKKPRTRSRNVTKKAGKKVKGEKGKKPVKAIGERDKRLPKPGTTLTREWHGKKYPVKVLDSGFEYGGKPYRSLSGVAKAISCQIVNGYLWFGLIPKEEK